MDFFYTVLKIYGVDPSVSVKALLINLKELDKHQIRYQVFGMTLLLRKIDQNLYLSIFCQRFLLLWKESRFKCELSVVDQILSKNKTQNAQIYDYAKTRSQSRNSAIPTDVRLVPSRTF